MKRGMMTVMVPVGLRWWGELKFVMSLVVSF